MSRARDLAAFLRSFVIGDDWRIAAGVAGSIVLAWAIRAWEVMPAAALLVLSAACLDGARRSR